MTERNLVNITITMTKEERKAIKQIALDNDISVSALIREWIAQYSDESISNSKERKPNLVECVRIMEKNL